MFDIGFAELVLIFIVGLLVLGPERLPAAVRTVSLWVGRLRRSFTAIRDEIEREVGADEIKRQLHNESILAELKESRDALEDTVNQTRGELKNLEYDISDATKPPRTADDPSEPPSAPNDRSSTKDPS